MRLAEITLKEFMRPVDQEIDRANPEGQNLTRENDAHARFLESEYHAGRAGKEIERPGTVTPIEFVEPSGMTSVLGGRDGRYSTGDKRMMDWSSIVNGRVNIKYDNLWIINYLLEDKRRIAASLDLESSCLSKQEVDFRIDLHRAASVRAYLRGDDVHPDNVGQYIAPLKSASREVLESRAESYRPLHELTYEQYCHPDKRVIPEEGFGNFEKRMIEPLDDKSVVLEARLNSDELEDAKLEDLDIGSRRDDCRLQEGQGFLVMTDPDATEVRGMISMGTSFVPEHHRGKGYGKAMLLAIGGFHGRFLAPSHFSEGGCAIRKAAHRDAVIEAHEKGQWLRPSVKEHYAQELGLEVPEAEEAETLAM